MPDLSSQIFVQLYSKLAATLSVKATVGHTSGSMLSLMWPGLYIQPGLDMKNPRVQYQLSNILNPTLLCDWTVVTGSATVSDVYKAILDGKETPLVHLTSEQQQKLDAARDYLLYPDGEPTPIYKAYGDYQGLYLIALDAYEQAAATAANGGPSIPPAIQEDYDQAAAAWNTLGYRHEVEQALATIAQYEGLEPAAFWAKLSSRYNQWTRTYDNDSEFQYVTSAPPYETWFSSGGWSDFTFDNRDFDNQERSGGVGVGGAECCCGCRCGRPETGRTGRSTRLPGGFRYATSANFRRDSHALPTEPVDFSMTCRLKRIEIVRPWLDANVLHSRVWRWSPLSAYYGVVVSTGGDIAGNVVPNGVMTMLPTAAVLATDISIHWNDPTLVAELDRHLAAGHELCFGPFRLSRATVDSRNIISASGPQMIAYLSAILPECPHPDPLLPWPLSQRDPAHWFGA